MIIVTHLLGHLPPTLIARGNIVSCGSYVSLFERFSIVHRSPHNPLALSSVPGFR